MQYNNKQNLSKGEFVRSFTSVVLIIFFLITLLSAGFLFYIYKTNENLLVSSLEPGTAVRVSYASNTKDQETSLSSVPQGDPFVAPDRNDNLTEVYGIIAVSTGEIEEVELKGPAGEALGRAVVLKVVSVDDSGKTKKFNIALQVFPGNETESITPWFIEFPARFREVELTESPLTELSKEEILKIFPRGTWWEFLFLYDLNSSFISEDMKKRYVPLARKYYLDDTGKLMDFITSGLTNSYKRTILLWGVNTYP